MERQQAAIASAASQFESATGNIPDPSLSVATQLEQAISTIKANVKLILDAKAESQASKTVMIFCLCCLYYIIRLLGIEISL